MGEGVSEFRIDFGPGYGIYFGSDGDQLVVLLGDGSKSGRLGTIADAKIAWQEYKHRKKGTIKTPASKKKSR